MRNDTSRPTVYEEHQARAGHIHDERRGQHGAGFMAFFGVASIVIALINAGEGFYNATADKRMSLVDVVDGQEEPDPLNERFSAGDEPQPPQPTAYCPYCGMPVEPDFVFCPRCGKTLRKA